MQKNKRGRKQTDRRASQGIYNPIDVYVGARIRERRTALGLTQEKLSVMIGMTFQQVQKYENGANRVSSSRLFDISRVLDVNIGYFFDKMPDSVMDHSPANLRNAGIDGDVLKESGVADIMDDPMFRRETIVLVSAYMSIADVNVRQNLRKLVFKLASAEDANKAEEEPAEESENMPRRGRPRKSE